MAAKKHQLGFLASHGGTNMQAIIDVCKKGRLEAEPRVVIGNNSRSGALERAAREGIPVCHLSSRTHPEPGDLDPAILDVGRRRGVAVGLVDPLRIALTQQRDVPDDFPARLINANRVDAHVR